MSLLNCRSSIHHVDLDWHLIWSAPDCVSSFRQNPLDVFLFFYFFVCSPSARVPSRIGRLVQRERDQATLSESEVEWMIMEHLIAMDQIKTWWSVLIYIQIEQHHSLDSLPRNQIALINYKMEFKQQEVLEDLTSKGWCSTVELRSRRISWDQSQQVKCFRCLIQVKPNMTFWCL